MFELSAAGTIWDENFQITMVDTVLNSSLILYGSTFGVILENGWDFISSQNPENDLIDQYGGVFGYGIYKLSLSSDSDHYIYICYFDCQYPDNCTGDKIWGQDISIVYDDSIYKWQYTEEVDYHWLVYGDTVTMDQCLSPICFDCFQPTNPTGLTVTKVNNHPKLTWNESSAPPSVPKYNVYRSSESVYHCIASYLDTNTYTDDDVTFNKFGGTYQYKVRAVSGDSSVLSPGYSNIVTFLGDGPIEKKIVAEPVNEQPDYFPLKIFPNPFNRIVQIQFQLPSDKVYNTEIYSLSGHCVWDYSFTPQTGGNSFSWNGSDRNGNVLPSGIYFLIVKSGNHPILREKLMYLK